MEAHTSLLKHPVSLLMRQRGNIFTCFYCISLWEGKFSFSWTQDTSRTFTVPSALGLLHLRPSFWQALHPQAHNLPATPGKWASLLHPASTFYPTFLWLALSSFQKPQDPWGWRCWSEVVTSSCSGVLPLLRRTQSNFTHSGPGWSPKALDTCLVVSQRPWVCFLAL